MKTLLTFCLPLVLLTAGCVELPQTNDPPAAPVLASTGLLEPGLGVGIDVTCTDPDDDRVTIQFSAALGGVQQDFNWTSFIDSGATETFYLGLGYGDWVIRAVARDELDEEGEVGVLELNVHP